MAKQKTVKRFRYATLSMRVPSGKLQGRGMVDLNFLMTVMINLLLNILRATRDLDMMAVSSAKSKSVISVATLNGRSTYHPVDT